LLQQKFNPSVNITRSKPTITYKKNLPDDPETVPNFDTFLLPKMHKTIWPSVTANKSQFNTTELNHVVQA